MCFLNNRTKFCLERQAFNWLLQTSSGPKENISKAMFIYTQSVSENVYPNNYVFNVILKFQFYKTDVGVLCCDRCQVTDNIGVFYLVDVITMQ